MTGTDYSDNRWQELARVLLEYSTETKKGDRVLIIMRETDTNSLARGVYREAIKVGAFPQVLFSSCSFERDLIQFVDHAIIQTDLVSPAASHVHLDVAGRRSAGSVKET